MRFALAFTFTFGDVHDPWIGADKLKHFVVAAVIETAAYAAIRQTKTSPSGALTGATLFTAGISVGKELFDYRRTGHFSVRDLVWDAAGAGTAYAILRSERP